MPTRQPRMVDWTTQQGHHGVRPQVTVIHIYRLIYRHCTSFVLCPLRGIPKQISGWRLTPYSHPQIGQLGQIMKRMDKSRYKACQKWFVVLAGQNKRRSRQKGELQCEASSKWLPVDGKITSCWCILTWLGTLQCICWIVCYCDCLMANVEYNLKFIA